MNNYLNVVEHSMDARHILTLQVANPACLVFKRGEKNMKQTLSIKERLNKPKEEIYIMLFALIISVMISIIFNISLKIIAFAVASSIILVYVIEGAAKNSMYRLEQNIINYEEHKENRLYFMVILIMCLCILFSWFMGFSFIYVIIGMFSVGVIVTHEIKKKINKRRCEA